MKKPVKLAGFLLAVTIFWSMLVTACGDSNTVTTGPSITTGSATISGSGTTKARTLNVGLRGDINALDPVHGYDDNTNSVILQITEGLFYYDQDNRIAPKLAKGVKIVDPTTYVYQIRDNVTFSDGTPLTVDDVIFSLERYRDPAVASDLAWMFANVSTVTKTGDWEVTVKLSKPDALWQQALATTAGHVISKKYFEAHKANFGKPDGGLLGTGPFIFKKWTTGSEIVLEKNPTYWDKTSTNQIDKIVFKIIPDLTSEVAALKAGQVDLVNSPPVDQLDQIRASKDLTVSLIDSFYFDFLAFNTDRKPFDDVNVRKAIYYAVDRDSIYKYILKDTAKPANSLPIDQIITNNDKDYWASYLKSAPDYKYDLNKAKEYLAKSSVPNGFTATLTMSDDTARNSIALSIQQSLKQLNISINIQKLSFSEYFPYQFGGKIKDGKRDYDFLLGGWVSDFPDPAGNVTPMFYSAYKGAGGSNAASYNNPKVDQLLDAQTGSLDPKERAQFLQQALDIISAEVPYAVISYPKFIFAHNKKIQYTFSASFLYNLFFKDFKFID
jgi:peptide/nickel transport system substrate-binding protein